MPQPPASLPTHCLDGGAAMKKFLIGAAAGAVLLAAGNAFAGAIPYPNSGVENPITYTFTATSTGNVTVYFAGSGASYDEQIGLLVNGVDTGVLGLDDHSSNIGDSFSFGSVNAGDILVFYDKIFDTGDTWFTTKSMNSDGSNHVYSTAAAAGDAYFGSPAGIYVGFEDLQLSESDLNYYDDTFVFTNVSAIGTPEPGVWAMMFLGLAGVGASLRRRNSMLATAR